MKNNLCKLSEELKNDIDIYAGQQFLSYRSKHYCDCLIHNSQMARPTKIPMSFWSSSDNSLSDPCIMF